MDGRPATMIRSEGCRPPILPSRSVKPVARPGQAAVAPIGVGRHVDGVGQGGGEGLEARAVLPGLGELIELLLGVLDLHRRRCVDRRVVGGVDHVLADLDQVPADGEVVDGTAVILGVDDGGGIGCETPEILRHGQLADRLVALEEGLERDRCGALTRPDQLRRVVVDPPMQCVVEMLRFEEARHPVAGLVIHQDGAKKRLLRLEIMGRGAEGRRLWGRRNGANQRIGHRSTLAKSGQGTRALGCEQRGELGSLTTSGPCPFSAWRGAPAAGSGHLARGSRAPTY